MDRYLFSCLKELTSEKCDVLVPIQKELEGLFGTKFAKELKKYVEENTEK